MLSDDRLHELTNELTSLRTHLTTIETRAATSQEQIARQKKALQEMARDLETEREQKTRATRMIQQLAKK